VLERQIKRVKWMPADRLVLAALRDRLPTSAWGVLQVRLKPSWVGTVNWLGGDWWLIQIARIEEGRR
jgi:hypothetical protein